MEENRCHCKEAKRCDTPCYINCAECDKVINYSQRFSYRLALKRSKNPGVCSSCNKTGERNPFFGRKHTKESMEKMIETSNNSEKRKEYYEKIKSEEYRKFLSDWMKENSPMRGKHCYTIWIEKYGQEEADKMYIEYRKKIGESVSGEKNYWYGKTPPYGSGNGWSGWYKGWYFRSLLELSYMINVIEKYDIKWKNGESSKYRMTYEYQGKTSNYVPDFILEDKYMVECKPKNLWGSDKVDAKRLTAEIFCRERGLIYKIREVPRVTDDEVYELYINGIITWTERYEEKFLNRYNKTNNSPNNPSNNNLTE